MSNNIALLKEKLKQQKEKDQRKILEVKVQKQKNFVVPVTPKTVKKKMDEEQVIRDNIKNFLSEIYSDSAFQEENKMLEEKVRRKMWKKLPKEGKLEYSLKSLLKNAPAGRVKFVMELLKVPESMRESFLNSYLNQPRNYSTYLELWTQEHKKELKDVEDANLVETVETKSNSENISTSKKLTVNRSREIVDELVNRMINYGKQELKDDSVLKEVIEEKGKQRELGKRETASGEELIKVKGKKITVSAAEESDEPVSEYKELKGEDKNIKRPGYYKIIDTITESPKKRKKIHERIARDYIKIAEILGIENAAELEIAQLAAQIAARERTLKLRADYEKVMSMERKKLLKKLKSVEDEESLSDYMLRLMYLEQQKMSEEMLRRSPSSSSDVSPISQENKRRQTKRINGENLGGQINTRSSDRSPSKKRKKERKRENKRRKLQMSQIIKKVLGEEISSRSLDICVMLIVNKTGLSEEYVATAVNILKNTLKSKTNEELFTSVATFLAYYSFPLSVSFKSKVDSNYYIPDFLLTLSPNEMLPEAYRTAITEESMSETTQYIKNEILKRIELIAEKYHRLQDVTAKLPMKHEKHEKVPSNIQYSSSACVNGEDLANISQENLIFYKDEEGLVYCLDSEKIADRFSNKNFENPVSKKPFSKNFIKKYMVVYIDPEDNKIYNLSFSSLQKQFKKNNFVNAKTGREFTQEFIEQIQENTYVKPVSYLEGKFSQTLTSCENFSEVIGEDIRNIVFYKDKKDKKLYCFTIQNLLNNTDNINKATGTEFSKGFLETVKAKYNIPENKQEVIKVVENSGDDALIIPDLWNLVKDSIKVEEETPPQNTSPDAETKTSSNSSNSDGFASETEEEEKDVSYYVGKLSKKYSMEKLLEKLSKGLEKYSAESGIKDRKELLEKLKDWKEENDLLEDIDTAELKRIAKEISKVEMGFEGGNDKENSEAAASANAPVEVPAPALGLTTSSCHKCKKPLPENFFKTVLMVEEKPEIVFFCSTACIEDEKFPTHRKVKQRKRKAA